MIVYGDPADGLTLTEGGEILAVAVGAAARADAASRADALRDVLIWAGRIEQAAEDAPLPGPVLERVRSVTDRAAEAFLGEAGAIERLSASVNAWPAHETALRAKVPEGFAFYRLYPEQYVAAAEAWLVDHPPRADGQVLVVGVRSIGTSLSALVRAVLARGGWRAGRFTVRPTGQPFDREVRIEPEQVAGTVAAVVVDEGPGASGSSMAAVGRALESAGLAAESISALPGHAGEPGGNASRDTRAWWADVRRYVVPGEQLRWGGKTLAESLADKTSELLGGEEMVRVEDVGGGEWRRIAYESEADWPGACALFERPKLACVGASGRRVLWKFEGLGGRDAEAVGRLDRLAGSTDVRTPVPLGRTLGFVATEWVEGRRLTSADASGSFAAQIGRYIRVAAGAPLARAESLEAFDRLGKMIYWNLWEVMGEGIAQLAQPKIDAAAEDARGLAFPRYGDGRLAPFEFLLDGSAALWKFDCAGHDSDHTIVGPQPILWDVAGAIVEWELNDELAGVLVESACGADASPALLDFYRLAYAVFRIGMCTVCSRADRRPQEKMRLDAQIGIYRDEIARRLAQ